MKNNKGTTIIEILISICIIAIIIMFLFNLLLQIRNEDNESNINSIFIINQATMIKEVEEDIVNYGISNISSCTLQEANVGSELVNPGYEDKVMCMKIKYAADYTEDNIGFIMLYNTYARFDVKSGEYVGREDSAKWMIQYVRGHYKKYNGEKPVLTSWKNATKIMKEYPNELDTTDKGYVKYTMASASAQNGAEMVLPIINSQNGEHYDINIGYLYQGNKDFTCSIGAKKANFECRCSGDSEYCRNSVDDAIMVTFNANGGTVSTISKTVDYGDKYGTLPIPVRDGYEFLGWYTSVAGGNQITNENMVTIANSHELYAHWKLIDYEIIYTLNGGSVSLANPTSYNVETETFTLENPEKRGYTFTGWSGTNIKGLTTSYTVEQGTARTISLTANFTINTYTVTFNNEGGNNELISKTVTYGSTYGTLPTPEREGYTFDGWYTEEIGGTKITSTTKVNVISDETLHAHWIKNNYSVAFNSNGGSTVSDVMTIEFASPYGTLPTTTRKGYTFTGWYTEKNGGRKIESTTIVDISSSHTLYAHWTVNTYLITFNVNGGTSDIISKEVTYDSVYGDLPVPTKAGYAFEGWYTEVSGGNKIEAGDKVDVDRPQTLYAHWTINSYTVTFDATGGKTPVNSKAVTYGNPYGELPTPTKAGYVFVGWYTAESGGSEVKATTIVNEEKNHAVYARWKNGAYTLTYDANGGSEVTTVASITYGGTYGTLPTTSWTGHTFLGWYTSATGGTKIESTTTVTATANQILYAHWNASVYTISYTLNGGSISGHKTSYTADDSTFRLPTPTKTGYTFTGWSGTGITGTSKDVGVIKGSTGNRSYTANWTPTVYTITYTLNGGSISGQKKTYTIETASFTLPTPTRSYYTFKGWTGSNGSTAQTSVTIAKGSYGNKSYTANWTPISYSISYTLNGGSISGQPTSYTVETATFTLPTPTRSNYTFTGWTGSNGSTAQTSVTIAKGSYGNKSYSANWRANNYTWTYTCPSYPSQCDLDNYDGSNGLHIGAHIEGSRIYCLCWYDGWSAKSLDYTSTTACPSGGSPSWLSGGTKSNSRTITVLCSF